MNREFADQYAGLEQWHWWFLGRRQILQSVLQREIPTQTPLSIASVGCGPAQELSWLLPLAGVGGQVIGLDADSHHGRCNIPGIKFIVGTAESMPLRSNYCDIVLALDVLEHVDDDVSVLREIKRILRPGGLLVATVPAMPSLWGGQDVVSQHRRRYIKSTLRNAFIAAGLPIPRMAYFNSLLFPPIAAVRWTRSALGFADRARSDFEDANRGLLNWIFSHIFAAERHIIGRIPLWFGVSLLALARVHSVDSVKHT